MGDRVRDIGPERQIVEAIDRLTQQVDYLGNAIVGLAQEVRRSAGQEGEAEG